jgi:Uma2 family endonuclease
VNLKLNEPKSYDIEYPSSDGRPMAETDLHRDLMSETINSLIDWFAPDPNVYVSGNLLVYYKPGNKRRHVTPDVFVVRGVPNHFRKNYLIWEEGKSPEAVIEITSDSTKEEDIDEKFELYRDTIKVKEYFLFDPRKDYLDPPLCGYRLVGLDFVAIEPVNGRLPSEVLGLHLERDGNRLRLWELESGKYVPTRAERAETAEERACTAEERAKTAAVENERLRFEIEELKKRLGG